MSSIALSRKLSMAYSEKDSSIAWLVWLLAAGFFFLKYIVRVSPGVMAEQIMHDFHISFFAFGTLSSYFYYSYLAMLIPVGAVVDRFSVRVVVSIMCFVCGAAAMLFAVTNTFALAEFSRFVIGFSGAFSFVGAMKLATAWFHPAHFGLLAGATQALGMLGASIGEGPLSVFVEREGWRIALSSLSILMIILAMVMYLVIRDKPHGAQDSQAQVTHSNDSLLTGFKVVFSNPLTWVNALFVGLLFAPTAAFGELWGPLYLTRVYSLTPQAAASLVSFIFVGWAIGSPFFGWVSDRIGKRKIIMILSALFSLVFMTLLLYSPLPAYGFLSFVAFMYGVSNVGVATSYTAACEINPNRWVGISLGFTNMASVIIGAGFQPVIGYLLDKGWDGLIVNGMRYYSPQDFRLALLAMPICLGLCLIIVAFMKESFGGLFDED